MKENNEEILFGNLNIDEEKNSNENNKNWTSTDNHEFQKETSISNTNINIKRNEKEETSSKNEINEKKQEMQKESSKANKKMNFEMIKDFLNQSSEDEKYDQQIKENPLSLFDSIDEQKVKIWESTLYKITPNTRKIENEKEKKVLTDIIETKEQRVIQNDCKRTRVRESIIFPNFIQTLEKVLTYYCKKFKAIYKQGLNEIFGPLLLIQYKLKNYSLVSIINLGARLIDVFCLIIFMKRKYFH